MCAIGVYIYMAVLKYKKKSYLTRYLGTAFERTLRGDLRRWTLSLSGSMRSSQSRPRGGVRVVAGGFQQILRAEPSAVYDAFPHQLVPDQGTGARPLKIPRLGGDAVSEDTVRTSVLSKIKRRV